MSLIHGLNNSGCGYCQHSLLVDETDAQRQKYSHRSFGVTFSGGISARQYEDLLNRNWRRSGTYFYRPYNIERFNPQVIVACCPLVAIRLDSLKFQLFGGLEADYKKIQKEHCRVLRVFYNDLIAYQQTEKSLQQQKAISVCLHNEELRLQIQKASSQIFASLVVKDALDASRVKFEDVKLIINIDAKTQADYNVVCTVSYKIVGLLMSKFKGKQISLSVEDVASSLASIVQLKSNKGNLLIKCTECQRIQDQETKHSQHEKKESPRVTLLLKFDTSEFKNDEYQLFKQYQMSIHKDEDEEVTEQSYTRFLCNTGLNFEQPNVRCQAVVEVSWLKEGNTYIPQFKDTESAILQLLNNTGSYHMRYELLTNDDPKLIAVSVLDVLPTGLSSVYFFYDQAYKKQSPGIFSGLVEIYILQYMSQLREQFKYYYLGLHVHFCTKMLYKAQFRPSELLCPFTLNWTMLDGRVHQLLDSNRGLAKISLNDDYNNSLVESNERIELGYFLPDGQQSWSALDLLRQLNFVVIKNRERRIIPGQMLLQVMLQSFDQSTMTEVQLLNELGFNQEYLHVIRQFVEHIGLKMAKDVGVKL